MFSYLGVNLCDSRHCHRNDDGIGSWVIDLIWLALNHELKACVSPQCGCFFALPPAMYDGPSVRLVGIWLLTGSLYRERFRCVSGFDKL
jgi:hypothetical protein